jgi:hypothetical protein
MFVTPPSIPFRSIRCRHGPAVAGARRYSINGLFPAGGSALLCKTVAVCNNSAVEKREYLSSNLGVPLNTSVESK